MELGTGKLTLAAAFAAVLLHAAAARANLTAADTFSSDAEGWSSRDSAGAGTYENVVQGDRGGRLGVLLFGLQSWGGTIPDQEFIGEAYGDGEDDLIVAITNGGQSVFFDFYSDAGDNGGGEVAPAALYLYFWSDGGTLWYYDVLSNGTIPSSAGWTTYSVDLDYDAGWDTDGGGDATSFAADLATCTEFGVWIVYQDWDGQEYAVDNFEVYDVPVSEVPEPGTVALLFTGVAVLCGRIRRRRRDRFCA